MAEAKTHASGDDESALLAKIAERDKGALQRLYLRYHSKLMRFALRFVRQREDAEEVVNDVFMVVWKDAGNFEGRSRVSTWLMGIAYRRSLKQLRRESTAMRLVVSASTDDGEDPHLATARDESPLPNDALLRQETADVALNALPPDQRLMVELALVMGHSYPEIAEMADIPVNTVKTRMFHARKRMRDALLASGLGKDLAHALEV